MENMGKMFLRTIRNLMLVTVGAGLVVLFSSPYCLSYGALWSMSFDDFFTLLLIVPISFIALYLVEWIASHIPFIQSLLIKKSLVIVFMMMVFYVPLIGLEKLYAPRLILSSGLCAKFKPEHQLSEGHSMYGLSINEYKLVQKYWKGFPDIPEQAFNINYQYSYDGFLPDCMFSMDYEIPLSVKVDTFSFRSSSTKEYNLVTIHDSSQKINYVYSVW